VTRLDQGDTFAINLTQNVNTEDHRYNENALWMNGSLQRLGPARFRLDPARPLEPWHVSSACGAVDLEFLPQGERSEDLNLGLIQSCFHQPYGIFRGTVSFGGRTREIQDAFGVCEDHRARW
jgi:hypothetical protein